jgi:hypothetical protein
MGQIAISFAVVMGYTNPGTALGYRSAAAATGGVAISQRSKWSKMR